LNGGPFAFIVQRFPYFFGGRCFLQSTDRANDGTLTAERAINGADRKLHSGADNCFKAPVLSVQNADALYLSAGGNAPSAQNTFCHVPCYGRRSIDPMNGFFAHEP
jgi:hypothetical protein